MERPVRTVVIVLFVTVSHLAILGALFDNLDFETARPQRTSVSVRLTRVVTPSEARPSEPGSVIKRSAKKTVNERPQKVLSPPAAEPRNATEDSAKVVLHSAESASVTTTGPNQFASSDDREVFFRPIDDEVTPPVLPESQILASLRYPAAARRRSIEGTVILELLIDNLGTIQNITVVEDPGWGFVEAAKTALAGVKCLPAQWQGQAVAVRYRYPIRFRIQ